MPGIESKGIGARSNVAALLDAASQLAAIHEASCNAKDRQGAWNSNSSGFGPYKWNGTSSD
jgi:hypothetical protein